MSGDEDLELQTLLTEPWHPDLEPFLSQGHFGLQLRHPLVLQVMAPVPGWANRSYLVKSEALRSALGTEDWNRAVFLHERPWRLTAFLTFVYDGALKDAGQGIRDLATSIWSDSENHDEYAQEWTRLFAGWNPGDPLLLGTSADHDKFAALPDILTVHRGDVPDDLGWSWSLDRSIALFFAERFDKNHALLTGEVDKADVFGFITGRGESEVLVRRESVRNLRRG